MVYLIGDSHTQSFGSNFKTIWLEAPTAYQNIKKINQIDNKLNSLNINKDVDYLFFSFGEIDVRCHLGFISENNNRSNEDVISECLNRYLTFLDYYINQDYKIGVYGVVPSGPYNGLQGNGRHSYKTHIERNKLTEMFNQQLKNICENKNILFKSIFYEIVDKDNYFDYFSVDGIHLNGGLFKTKNDGVNCEILLNDLFKNLL
jgi:hypothetical protein